MVELKIPILDSARFRLEPLALSHSPGMFDLWCDPDVCEHSGPAFDANGRQIPLPAVSQRDSDRLLEYSLHRAREGTGFRWAIVLAAGSEIAGAVGFNTLGSCWEYAYHLNPRCWGVGIAREASDLAIGWSFSSGAERIEAFISAANTRSIRLAKRLGFEESGRVEEGASSFVLTPEQFAKEREKSERELPHGHRERGCLG